MLVSSAISSREKGGARLRVGPPIPAWIEDVAGAPEPLPDHDAVIHGDYVRANLLVDADQRVAAIDWDLVGFGDPMWDLAFLVEAEPDVRPDASAMAIAAYGEISAADLERLEWHRRCWRAFWWLRGDAERHSRAPTAPRNRL